MFVDIHTHVDNQSVIKIVDEHGEKILTTWGIHPWEVEGLTEHHFERNEQGSGNLLLSDAVDFSIPLLDSRNDAFFAIGEVGLDKIHKETFGKQIEVFGEMVRLSETYRKPMIIHCVRAYSEIIEIRKKTKATMSWVIHGFNSSVETMLQLLKHDIYISLGEVLYRDENQAIKILKHLPLDRLFLETDVSGRGIKDVYARAAALTGRGIDFLRKQIFENYGRLETTH